MAPREAGPAGSTSLFLNKLGSLWVVQSMEDLYSASKEKSALLTAGLEVLEKGVNMASNPVKKVVTSLAETCPNKVSTIDTFACECLGTLETKYPKVQEQAGNAVHSAQNALSAGLRRAFRTYPGRQVVRGLDAVIDATEKVLDNLTPVDQCVPEDRAENKDEQQHSGTDEVDEKRAEIGTQTRSWPGLLSRVSAPPLGLWLELLRQLRSLLIRACGLQHRAMLASLAASPVKKKVDIGRRRKLSPKKRLPRRSLLRKWVRAAFSMVGLKQWSPLSAPHSLNLAGLDEDEHETGADAAGKAAEKRKHHDVSDESSDDDTTHGNLKLDDLLRSYNSAEDSDYDPAGDNDKTSTDSMEYKEGDTESDVEAEKTGEEGKTGPLVQIKQQEQQPPEAKITGEREQPETTETSVGKNSPPKLALFSPKPTDTDQPQTPAHDVITNGSHVIESSVDVVQNGSDGDAIGPTDGLCTPTTRNFPSAIPLPEHLATPDPGQQSDPGQSPPRHVTDSPKIVLQPGWRTN